MDPDNLTCKWSEQKEKLKKQFTVLTDSDLSFEEGKKDVMLGNLVSKLGKTKEELTAIIGSL